MFDKISIMQPEVVPRLINNSLMRWQAITVVSWLTCTGLPCYESLVDLFVFTASLHGWSFCVVYCSSLIQLALCPCKNHWNFNVNDHKRIASLVHANWHDQGPPGNVSGGNSNFFVLANPATLKKNLSCSRRPVAKKLFNWLGTGGRIPCKTLRLHKQLGFQLQGWAGARTNLERPPTKEDPSWGPGRNRLGQQFPKWTDGWMNR